MFFEWGRGPRGAPGDGRNGITPDAPAAGAPSRAVPGAAHPAHRGYRAHAVHGGHRTEPWAPHRTVGTAPICAHRTEPRAQGALCQTKRPLRSIQPEVRPMLAPASPFENARANENCAGIASAPVLSM